MMFVTVTETGMRTSQTPRCEICGSHETRFLRDKYICLGCGHIPS